MQDGAGEQPGRDGAGDIALADDLVWQDRRALVRLDVNSPIEDGHVAGTVRLRAAAHSVRDLLDRGAGLVLLAHQGRPGRADFVDLSEHAEILSDEVGASIEFVPHIDDDEAVRAAQGVAPGQAILLDNVRKASGEIENIAADEHAERPWVRRLAAQADAFVLDAFPVSHRSHASVVGFPRLLPSCTGTVMAGELDALERVVAGDEEGTRVLVLGGAKVEDALKVIHHHLEGDLAERVLTGGLVGELFLMARGHDLGEPTERLLERAGATGFLSLATSLVERYDRAIMTPLDVAQDRGGRSEAYIEELPCSGKLLDIGPGTAEAYAEEIAQAETVVLNGPMGAYERDGFALGTEQVIQACAETDAYTLLGGGHTVTAMESAGFDRAAFGHVSLAGGALVGYLTGDPLPGIQALEESARRFAIAPGRPT